MFVAGRVWQEARERPMRDAMAIAAPRSAKAIVVAGITLALSFEALALVPLRSFRELAFALACGVLLETFLVRVLLVPAARAGAAEAGVAGDVGQPTPMRCAEEGREAAAGVDGAAPAVAEPHALELREGREEVLGEPREARIVIVEPRPHRTPEPVDRVIAAPDDAVVDGEPPR